VPASEQASCETPSIRQQSPRITAPGCSWATVERGGEDLLGERHADGVGKALAERPGGGLDAEVRVDLRVPGGVRTELAEIPELLHVERIAREVQQRVEQHRAVAVRDHEAVAVGPLRIAGIVLEVIGPQHLGDVGHAHRHAGVTGIGLLHGIHAEGTDGVGELPAGRHGVPLR